MTPEERVVLAKLISDFDAEFGSSRLPEIESLHVLARCGCGKCPTIMFVQEPEKKTGPRFLIADHYGIGKDGAKIGIHLWERDGKIEELEFWSIADDDVELPLPETIRPLSELRCDIKK